MNVLVVAPHCDDEVLGVGGTMAKLAKAGHSVFVLVMCDRSEGHSFQPRLISHLHDCCQKACVGVLGAKEVFFAHLREEKLDAQLSDVIVPMERYIAMLRPDLVFVPHRGDVNQDHRAVFQAAMVATRTLGNWEGKFKDEELPVEPEGFDQSKKIDARYNIRKVLTYEVSSTTEQAPAYPEWVFSPTTFVDITDELELKLKALSCYDTEISEFPFPRSLDAVRHLAAYRGMACALKAAEAFSLKREIVFDAKNV